METSQVKKTKVRIAVIDSDPLRFLGFRALLSSESDFDLQSLSLAEIGTHQEINVVLLGSDLGRNVLDVLTTMKALRPGLDVIVTGCGLDNDAILKAIAAGAKGCVDEAAPVGELVRAIRIVRAGSIWAPRQVLSMFVEQAYRSSGHGVSAGQRPFTGREKEVLGMRSDGSGLIDLGSKASSLHVRGAGIPILRARCFCRPATVHGPGKRSTRDARSEERRVGKEGRS